MHHEVWDPIPRLPCLNLGHCSTPLNSYKAWTSLKKFITVYFVGGDFFSQCESHIAKGKLAWSRDRTSQENRGRDFWSGLKSGFRAKLFGLKLFELKLFELRLFEHKLFWPQAFWAQAFRAQAFWAQAFLALSFLSSKFSRNECRELFFLIE